jgi:molecular chaperone GrpE
MAESEIANDDDHEPEAKEEKAAGKKEETEGEAELKERLLRMAAEFDNYKKRVAKEIDASKTLGKIELLKKILPTLDEFELAMVAMGKEGEHSKGIELVYSNFVSILKTAGLKEIEVDGTFDPYKHEIMLTKGSKEKEGTIIDVIRKGYTFNDIVVRPASVIVSKGKEDDTKNEKQLGE